MFVKLMVSKGETRTHQCTHNVVRRSKEGISIECLPGGPVFSIPEDGSEIYIMNDGGDTVDSYRWPPRRKAG